jgi:hypothetical protein
VRKQARAPTTAIGRAPALHHRLRVRRDG